jgi:hypothetical protein
MGRGSPEWLGGSGEKLDDGVDKWSPARFFGSRVDNAAV